MPSDPKEPLIVVVGPTASGKTELAVALAERLGAEIVSADSVQVYRHFEIGTGKPSEAERRRAPHHLIDIAEPDAPLDAASYAERAEATLAELSARGRRAVVCGGTFLWVRALIYGLAPAPPSDPKLRERHTELVRAEGRAALHAELARVDPDSAERLAPNDFVRVSRALEVFEQSGVPMSRFQREHGFRVARRSVRLIGLARSREEMDRRIAERVRAMLDAGWLEEVRALRARGFGATRAMSSIGYKQVCAALAASAAPDLALLSETIVRATRVFARRQRTWLRDQPVEWLAPSDVDAWLKTFADP